MRVEADLGFGKQTGPDWGPLQRVMLLSAPSDAHLRIRRANTATTHAVILATISSKTLSASERSSGSVRSWIGWGTHTMVGS